MSYNPTNNAPGAGTGVKPGNMWRMRGRTPQEMDYLWNVAHDTAMPPYAQDDAVYQMYDEYLFRSNFKRFYFWTIWLMVGLVGIFTIVFAAWWGLLGFALFVPVLIIVAVLAVVSELVNRKKITELQNRAYKMWTMSSNNLRMAREG